MPCSLANEPITVQWWQEQKKLLLQKVIQHERNVRHAVSQLQEQIQTDFREKYWKEELRKKKLELEECEHKKLELKEMELGIRGGNYEDLLSQLQKKGILEYGLGAYGVKT